MRHHLWFPLAFLAACTHAPVIPASARSPVFVPQLVVQYVAMPEATNNPWLGWGVVLSPDGSLLATFGPELRIIETQSGRVRGVLRSPSGEPMCVTDAGFSENGKLVTVHTCEGVGSTNDKGRYLSWDLGTDTVHPMRPVPKREPTREDATQSPDGTRAVMMKDGTLVIEDKKTGRPILRHPLSGTCAPIGWTHDGGRLAVSCHDDDKATVTLLDMHGTELCVIPSKAFPERRFPLWAHWSRDGNHVVITIPAGESCCSSIVRFGVPGCVRERVSAIGEFSRYETQWSENLVGVDVRDAGAYFYGPILVIPGDPAAPVHNMSEGRLPPFVRESGDRLRCDGFDDGNNSMLSWIVEPRSATGRFVGMVERTPVSTVSGVLWSVDASGQGAPVLGPPPVATTPHVLALVDGAGRRLELSNSGGYATREDQNEYLRRFVASPNGGFVAGVRYDKQHEQQWLAIWDAHTGRRVFEGYGGNVSFSGDETRAAVEAGNGMYLVDTAQGRVLVEHVIPHVQEDINSDYVIAFSGSLLAVGDVGVFDAVTGNKLWSHGYGIPKDPWPKGGQWVMTYGGEFDQFGQLELEFRNPRTGSLLRSMRARLEGWDAPHSLFLVRVSGSMLEVWDAQTLEVRARFGPAREAALSEDGKFVYYWGANALHIHRLADGVELYQIPSKGQPELSYTASGLFEGSPEALRRVSFRLEPDVARGRVLSLVEALKVNDPTCALGSKVSCGPFWARPSPGLVQDFFAGNRIGLRNDK